MGFMALIDKCWDAKSKFYRNKFYKNPKAETFIFFNKSSKKIWRRMWGENSAIYCHICVFWWVQVSPTYPHYLRGTWGLRKIAKKGEELKVLIKKGGCKKGRDPVKVGVGTYFDCNAPTPQADIKVGTLF